MGVAPTEPGMPERASTPTQPEVTARSTSASQDSPAATVTRRTSCPASSAALTVPTSSASEVASTNRPAGPPSRRVVRSARRCGGPGCSCSDSGTDDGLGGAEDLLVAAGDDHRDGGEPVGRVTHGAGDRHLDAVVAGGHHDRLGELAADLHDPAGAGPALDGPADQGHREHPVGDDAREPDGAGDLLVLVDGVLVATG